MHFLAHFNLFHLITQLSIVSMAVVMAGNYWFPTPSLCLAAEQAAGAADDDDSDDWMFDKSTYTNNPKTGKRVDQYKKEKTPYRDPNAWFDSNMTSTSFYYDAWGGGFYDAYNPFYYFGVLPEEYSKYYFGEDGSGYYPYDGDPNNEDDVDQQDSIKDEPVKKKKTEREKQNAE